MRPVGAGGLVRAPWQDVTAQQAALARLGLMCVAWAAGHTAQVLVPALRLLDLLLPAGLATGVYLLTQDLGRPRHRGGEVRYWRGRPIDDDPEDRRRFN